MSNHGQDLWTFKSRESGYEHTDRLVAYWEVHRDPMSDEYTPAEIGASELFGKWARELKKELPDGLLAIYWSVRTPQRTIQEFMPFQFPHLALSEDFLTHFTWPVNSNSGDLLNWLCLPVVDKLWNRQQMEKGGFIQQATTWKPSILQPHVYLPSLVDSWRRP